MTAEMDRFPSTSSRRGSEDKTNPNRHRTYEETSSIEGISDTTPLVQREGESELDYSVDEIKSKLPNADTSKFVSKLDEFNRVVVKLIRKGGKYHLLFSKDDEVNPKLPNEIIKALGEPADKISEAKKAEITRREKKIIELQENRKTATEAEKENIDRNINEQQDQINELERENEEIEGRMSLRDRIKAIFKKHGFTLTAVVVSVSVVISFLATNLKKGLTTLGSKFGGALKDVGRKLGQILPGLVGAIASFIFKTAGEAIGFLAKNAWLLQLNQVKRFAQESRSGFVLIPGRPPALRPLGILRETICRCRCSKFEFILRSNFSSSNRVTDFSSQASI